MAYMRIATAKFWGWVVVSLLVGLGIGLAIMLVRTGAMSSQISVLQHQLSAASSGVTESVAAVQAQLASAEASITALTQENAALQAQVSSTTDQSGTSTDESTTTAPTLVITSRTVTPSTVATSGMITMTVKVTGQPTSVTMRVYNASKSYDKTFSLKKISTTDETDTWRLKVAAPTKAGTYHFYATAKSGSERVTMVGASPGTLKVK